MIEKTRAHNGETLSSSYPLKTDSSLCRFRHCVHCEISGRFIAESADIAFAEAAAFRQFFGREILLAHQSVKVLCKRFHSPILPPFPQPRMAMPCTVSRAIQAVEFLINGEANPVE
jgi:hypothetical protein